MLLPTIEEYDELVAKFIDSYVDIFRRNRALQSTIIEESEFEKLKEEKAKEWLIAREFLLLLDPITQVRCAQFADIGKQFSQGEISVIDLVNIWGDKYWHEGTKKPLLMVPAIGPRWLSFFDHYTRACIIFGLPDPTPVPKEKQS